MRKILLFFLFLVFSLLILSPEAEARRGCCSWHGGVSYCDVSVGKFVCNDGTYSPTCACQYIPPKPESESTPSLTFPIPSPSNYLPTVIVTEYSAEVGNNDFNLWLLCILGAGILAFAFYQIGKSKNNKEEINK